MKSKKSALAAVAILLVVILGLVALARPKSNSSKTAPEALLSQVCDNVPQDIMPRAEVYLQNSKNIEQIAGRIRAAGDTTHADQAEALADQMKTISTALDTQQDTGDLLDQFLSQYHDFGC